jgi:glycosyltransferase involved in cell wall biosynthesis
MGKVLVVIPALDEEQTVASVITSVREYLDAAVLVIDDGSRDGTALEAAAVEAIVLRHPFNLGAGAALRTGFRYARDSGFDIVVQLDADGQHDPRDAKLLVDVLVEGPADVVIGSRFSSGYHTSRIRRVGMRMLSRRVSRSIGVEITDTTSGFRAFSRAAVTRFADAYPSAYLSDTVEALLLAGDWGLRVAEVPVHMRHRMGGTPSAGWLKSAFHLVRINLVLSLHRFRYPL